MSDVAYETILYEVDADDRVATITLNRPDALNAFDRTMCEEIRDAWHVVRDDDRVHAVVLRAAGDRAFSAGLDTKKSFGQPDVVWNHADPGEYLSPKWQKLWKPVVCAVQGMCTAGAFYFLNEADVVICSDDATFFDSHVTLRLRVGHRADRPDAAHRARRHVAHGAHRERGAGVGRDRAAPRVWSPRSSARADLWPHAHALARLIASYPTVATQGTVRAIWESLDKPYRAAMEQGLMYTRLGNPVGAAEVERTGIDRTTPPRIR